METPKPMPTLEDPEEEIRKLLEAQTRETLRKIAALADNNAVPLVRALRLVQIYSDHAVSLLGEFSVPHTTGSGLAAPLGGMGGALREVIDAFQGPLNAQRMQATAGAYRAAVDAGDHALAARLRAQIDTELGPPPIDIAPQPDGPDPAVWTPAPRL